MTNFLVITSGSSRRAQCVTVFNKEDLPQTFSFSEKNEQWCEYLIKIIKLMGGCGGGDKRSGLGRWMLIKVKQQEWKGFCIRRKNGNQI